MNDETTTQERKVQKLSTLSSVIDPFRVLSFRSDPIRYDPIRSDPVRSGPVRSDPIRIVLTADRRGGRRRNDNHANLTPEDVNHKEIPDGHFHSRRLTSTFGIRRNRTLGFHFGKAYTQENEEYLF